MAGNSYATSVGSFEARWSVGAVADVLRAADRPDDGLPPVAALIAAAREDTEIAGFRDELLAAWGRLIVSCICVVDPGLVLLSGAAAELDTHSFATLDAIVQAGAPSPTEVRRAELGPDAVLHGAVSAALSAAGLLAPPPA